MCGEKGRYCVGEKVREGVCVSQIQKKNRAMQTLSDLSANLDECCSKQ